MGCKPTESTTDVQSAQDATAQRSCFLSEVSTKAFVTAIGDVDAGQKTALALASSNAADGYLKNVPPDVKPCDASINQLVQKVLAGSSGQSVAQSCYRQAVQAQLSKGAVIDFLAYDPQSRYAFVHYRTPGKFLPITCFIGI